jgi:hypothetical protein
MWSASHSGAFQHFLKVGLQAETAGKHDLGIVYCSDVSGSWHIAVRVYPDTHQRGEINAVAAHVLYDVCYGAGRGHDLKLFTFLQWDGLRFWCRIVRPLACVWCSWATADNSSQNQKAGACEQ